MKKIFFMLFLSLFILNFISSFNFNDLNNFGFNFPENKYLLKGGDNTTGSYNFNGGWMNNGLSIIGGDIYANTGYFYNISALNVTKQQLTIIENLSIGKNLSVGGSDFFVNNDLGRIGIGTSNPSQKLTISSGNVSLDAGKAFDWGNGNSRIIGDSNWNLIFSTYTGTTLTEKMRILSNGNIGIGTISPQQKLHVNGSVLVNESLKVIGNATYNGYYAGMWFHNDTGISVSLNSTPQTINLNINSNYRNGFNWFGNSTLELMDKNGEGLYHITWKAEGIGTQNHEYHGWVFTNEVQQNNTIGHAIGQASNAVDMLGLGMIRINQYDNVTIRLADMTSPSSVSAIDGNVNLVRVGN